MHCLTKTKLVQLLGLPPPEAPKCTLVSDEAAGDLWLRHFEIGKARVPAVLLSRRDVRPGQPAVLYCHAHGNAYSIGKVEVSQGRPALLDPPLARVLAKAGMAVFCVDMPGFGARQVEGSEVALVKAALWRGETLLGQMIYDQLLARLAMTDILHPSRVAALGISMGATLAYLVAGLDSNIDAVVQLCVFADMAPLIDSGAHDLHGPYMTIPGLLRAHDMSDIAALVAPRAQFVGTGALDALTPNAAYDTALARLREAYRACPDQLEVLREPDAGHWETPDMRKAVLAFLQQHLSFTLSRDHAGSVS